MKLGHTNKLLSGVLLALGACGVAQADTTYTYAYSYNWSVPGSCAGGVWHNDCTLSGGAPTLTSSTSSDGSSVPADPHAPGAISSTATGWANTNGGGDPQYQTIEQGQVQAWGGSGGYGLGIKNADAATGGDPNEGNAPEHAVDNNDRYDSMLYSFSDAVALTSVLVTYSNTDIDYSLSDIIVLAYTGSDPFINDANNSGTKLAGLTYGQLVNEGWTLVGNYANLGAGETRSINTGTTTGGNTYAGIASSSYWLIGAANNLVAGGANNCGSWGSPSCTSTLFDAVKLGSLGATVTTTNTTHNGGSVPEPGSLVLMGLGSLLLVRTRARKSC